MRKAGEEDTSPADLLAPSRFLSRFLPQGAQYRIKEKSLKPVGALGFFAGAASQIRTGDLILTKDALYRLSYSSICT